MSSKRRHPIRNLTAQLLKHDAFRAANTSRIALFYVKLMLQEPFRLRERFNHRKDLRKHQLSKDPVFIIGHWRSGTSFMQYLLGQDPQFGYLNKFEAVFPDVFLASERLLKSWARRIPETFNLTRDAKNMSIDLEWDSPSEVEIALTTMISPASPHWGHIFPQDGNEYFNKYLFFDGASQEEINRWNKDFAHLIKKVSLKNKGQRVIVKSPGNTSRIRMLLEMYPNARFIFLHRNPYDVFYSSQKLWHTLVDNLALQAFSQRQMEQQIIAIYQRLMQAYLQQRALLPEDQLIEIRFDAFVTDPISELSATYEKLSIEGFDEALPRFRSFLEDRADGRSSRYQYKKDDVERINEAWDFAFESWNYTMQRDDAVAAR